HRVAPVLVPAQLVTCTVGLSDTEQVAASVVLMAGDPASWIGQSNQVAVDVPLITGFAARRVDQTNQVLVLVVQVTFFSPTGIGDVGAASNLIVVEDPELPLRRGAAQYTSLGIELVPLVSRDQAARLRVLDHHVVAP